MLLGQLLDVPDVVSEHHGNAVPHAKNGRQRGGPESNQEDRCHEAAIAVTEDVSQINQSLIALGNSDVGRVEQVAADDEHCSNKDAGDHVSHGVVEAHDAHPRRGVPAFLMQPVAISCKCDCATHTTGKREHINE